MSTFSNSEPAIASSSDNHTSPRNTNEQSRSQSGWLDKERSDDGSPPLEMDRCPECGARRFVSKLLMYEVTSYDEGGSGSSVGSTFMFGGAGTFPGELEFMIQTRLSPSAPIIADMWRQTVSPRREVRV